MKYEEVELKQIERIVSIILKPKCSCSCSSCMEMCRDLCVDFAVGKNYYDEGVRVMKEKTEK